MKTYLKLNLFFLFSLTALFLGGCQSEEPIDHPTQNPQPQQEYPQNGKSERGYIEGNTVKMSSSAVFVKNDIISVLKTYDEESGKISFEKIPALDNVGIKEGDLIYSTEITANTPDGICARVVSVQESDKSITYQTIPVSVLEVFELLHENMTISGVSPEKVQLYDIAEQVDLLQSGNVTKITPITKGLTATSLDGNLTFKSDAKNTSFTYTLWESESRSSSGGDFKGKLKLEGSLNLTHDFGEKGIEHDIDHGKVQFGSLVNLGATIKLKTVLEGKLNNTDKKNLEERLKQELLNKKFLIASVPLNVTWTKVIVNPVIELYGEFKATLSGDFELEVGVKNGILAINVENESAWSPDFETRSYARFNQNPTPVFNVQVDLNVELSAGVDVGFAIQVPALKVYADGGDYKPVSKWNLFKKKREKVPSFIGIYYGIYAKDEIKFSSKYDPLSNVLVGSCTGGKLNVGNKIFIEGLLGIKDKIVGDFCIDYPINDFDIVDPWEVTWEINTPIPVNLRSSVNGHEADLTWDSVDKTWAISYDVYLKREGQIDFVRVAKDLKDKQFHYVASESGICSWYVVAHTLSGDEYTSAEASFEVSGVVTSAPTNGLVAYFPFNGNANDATGNGHNGTIVGNVTLTSDRYGNSQSAYWFPGTAWSYISVPHSTQLIMDEFTLSAWVYSDNEQNAYGFGKEGYIINKGRDINSGSYRLRSRSVGAQVKYNGTNDAYVENIPSLGAWHMITGTVKGSSAKFYVDGVLKNETKLSSSFTCSNNEILTIGMHYYSGVPSTWAYPHYGAIDDVYIYNRELNAKEVMELYKQ